MRRMRAFCIPYQSAIQNRYRQNPRPPQQAVSIPGRRICSQPDLPGRPISLCFRGWAL